MEVKFDPRKVVTIEYTNHRKEHGTRRIVPEYLWWGVTAWHPEEGWLLHAFDLDKAAYRDFAWSGISEHNHVPERILRDTGIPLLDAEEAKLYPRWRDRRMNEAEKAFAVMQFHEWCLASGYEDVARKFIEMGLMDGRRN